VLARRLRCHAGVQAKLFEADAPTYAVSGAEVGWSQGAGAVQLRRLERQQAVLARFTEQALTPVGMAVLAGDLARAASEALDTAIEVCELTAEGKSLVVRGSAGAGAAPLGTTSALSPQLPESTACASDTPVVLFDGSLCAGVGRAPRAWGVVVAHVRRRRFLPADTQFLATLARIFAGAVERERLEGLCQQAQKMETLGQLAGGVAHDFNNVLAVIGTSAFTVAESLRPGRPAQAGADRAEDLQLITKAVERGRLLVRRLLVFSRTQAERDTRLDLNDVVAEARRMLERLMIARVELTAALAPERLPIRADLGELEQVIVNLVVNARDAMPNGGTVRLATAHRPGPHGCGPGCHAALVVADTGVGISRETQRRMFEPFFTTKAAGRGTGLGLATVKQIVDRAHGEIRVVSAPGAGTTVTVLWPCDARKV
jgi:signal transduction histidine kinase